MLGSYMVEMVSGSGNIWFIFFFQNEEVFVPLDRLDELDRITHAWIRIQLQPHTNTENILM